MNFVFALCLTVFVLMGSVSAYDPNVDLINRMMNITRDWTCRSTTWVPNVTSVCSWDGMECVNGTEPTWFKWNDRGCRGTLTSDQWPDNMIGLELQNNLFNQADLLWGRFPSNAEVLDLSNNQLTGGISVVFISQKIKKLNLSRNGFTYEFPMRYFWKNIESIDVSYNRLSGTFNTTELSSTIREIIANNNLFSGLPNLALTSYSNMYTLDIRNNLFCGNVTLPMCFPQTLVSGMCTDSNQTNQDPITSSCDPKQPYNISCRPCPAPAPTPSPASWDVWRLSYLTGPWSVRDPSWNNASGSPCTWAGVTCNEAGRAIGFIWQNKNVSGEVDLSWLPSELGTLDLQGNRFTRVWSYGEFVTPKLKVLNLANNLLVSVVYAPWVTTYNLSSNQIIYFWSNEYIPSNVTVLDLSNNMLTGSFDVVGIPQSLQVLRVQNNQFNSVANLAALPPSVQDVDISGNSFCNYVRLPKQCPLNLKANNLCGVNHTNPTPTTCFNNNTEKLFCSNTCIDPKYDPQLLQMRNFTDSWTCKDVKWIASNPVCEWPGVLCENGTIVEFSVTDRRNCIGNFSASFLPRSLRSLYLETDLTGEVNLSALPRTLQTFHVANNRLSGDLVFADMPDSLVTFDVTGNSFRSWQLSFGQVPKGLQQLHLNSNKITGLIDNLGSLPSSLYSFKIAFNALDSSPDWSALPETVRILDIRNTSLCGTMKLPSTCSLLKLDANYSCVYGATPVSKCNQSKSTLTCSTPCSTAAPTNAPPPTNGGGGGEASPEEGGLSAGGKAGIAIAVIVVVAIGGYVLYRRKTREDYVDTDYSLNKVRV